MVGAGSIKQCLHQLTLLSKQWAGVIPDNLFDMSMGSLVHTAMRAFADATMSLEDITEEETHTLRQLLSTLCERVPALWGARASDELLAASVPVWTKFGQLVDVLEASLAGITQTWRDGGYAFAPEELRALVKALFSNTERRAQSLAAIC